MKLRRSTGDQFAPAPNFVSVPKAESWSTSALPLIVRLPRALKSWPRREIGRSTLTAAVPVVRSIELGVVTIPVRRSLSRLTVLAPTRSVVLALPAGTLNRLPFAVAVTSPEVVVSFFQAEDGIRGIGVTGVQTCALPI